MSTDKLAEGRLEVRYPCGTVFTATGALYYGPPAAGMDALPVIVPDDVTVPALVLDSRAVVTLLGAPVFGPRRRPDGRPAWVSEWLAEHSDWDS